jgi:hypothetical protein
VFVVFVDPIDRSFRLCRSMLYVCSVLLIVSIDRSFVLCLSIDVVYACCLCRSSFRLCRSVRIDRSFRLCRSIECVCCICLSIGRSVFVDRWCMFLLYYFYLLTLTVNESYFATPLRNVAQPHLFGR